MVIHQALKGYPITDEQEAIISHEHGPLLVIAGPGSGKTHSLALLAMNLLLNQRATPSELVLCTYTEKSALEMRDRLTRIANEVNFSSVVKKDLSQMRIDTIHGICTKIIAEHVQDTPLGNGYETLDQFPQQLLIFEHLEELCDTPSWRVFQERWGTRWKIAKGLQFCFDRIVDELILDDLTQAYPFSSKDYSQQAREFLQSITRSYIAYQRMLGRTHRVDFAHLQKIAYNLLIDPHKAIHITQRIKYVLVDEYQDTNYIQEQILIKLASATGNLCVVGDEDQALYRFRGATVRNILEFTKTCATQTTFPACKTVQLTTNYRSHPKIIDMYNTWMHATDWHNSEGTAFRTEKTIKPSFKRSLDQTYNPYPALFAISEESIEREAYQFAEFVETLKTQAVIADYSHVALLLHSVKPYLSGAYIEALKQKNIPAFCPRARTYFEQDEVRLMVGCFAQLFGYEELYDNDELDDETITPYIRECQELLQDVCLALPELVQELDVLDTYVMQQTDLNSIVADCFYRLLALEPFLAAMQEQFKLDALIALSQIVGTFQQCYCTYDMGTREEVQQKFFHTFLRLLHADGANQRENPHQMIPVGHVQIMTVHQAKGLEFPVVVLGRLDKQPPQAGNEDRELKRFYHKQPPFEPENRISGFDLARNYYVAFSRAEHILVLSAGKYPHKYVAPLFKTLPCYTSAHKTLLPTILPQKSVSKQHKRRYSFTQDITTYETCPRRYEYFHEHGFQASQPADYFVGQLVHQTLENIHRTVCKGRCDSLHADAVSKMFEKVAACLEQKSRGIKKGDKEEAFRQVLNYFQQNQRELQYVERAEVPISFEKEEYVLTGQIDLLMRVKGKLHLLDFKTGQRQRQTLEQLAAYERQLCTYAHIIEQRGEELPERLFIYWTGEERKQDALMEVHYQPEEAENAGHYFDTIVTRIHSRVFTAKPGSKSCITCDLRSMCMKEGIL
ncbi:MAG: ATP-dependent DNA helicase [Ktedonobacteraceae bacterium]